MLLTLALLTLLAVSQAREQPDPQDPAEDSATAEAPPPDAEVKVGMYVKDPFYHYEWCGRLAESRSTMTVAQATANGLKPHASCILAAPALECAREYNGKNFKLIGALPAEPDKGVRGNEDEATGRLNINANGHRRAERGATVIPGGDLVTVTAVEMRSYTGGHGRGGSKGRSVAIVLDVRTLLQQNITRGRGAFQHESPEYLRSEIALLSPGVGGCERVRATLVDILDPADEKEVNARISRNPSGVEVVEVAAGMSPMQVERALGVPERKATIGAKTIYFYPRMKVTFVSGKVTDVE